MTTTTAKIEANRRNALASTGPKSVEGKAAVAGNAVRHGLLSWKPTIPGMEDADEWDAHLEYTQEALAPVGYMETVLAERIALLYWRLGRVARYEREAAALGVEQAEIDWTKTLPYRDRDDDHTAFELAERAIKSAQPLNDLAESLLTLPPDKELDRHTAAKVLRQASESARVDLNESGGWPDYVNGLRLEDVQWTAARLLECLRAVAECAKIDWVDVFAVVAWKATDALSRAERKLKDLRQDFDRFRRSLLLPATETLDRVSRYETTLERSLYKALHELERRQAARAGHVMPPPVALDVTVSGTTQE